MYQMQVLVDRKVKKVMLKFVIYSSRTSSDEVIFGVENFNCLKKLQEASRIIPGSFQAM